MKRLELYKYPKNILIPVVLFIIGMVVLFVVYKINSVNVNDTPEVKSPVKMSLNTKANFNVDTAVKIDDSSKSATEILFNGSSLLNIDLSSGEITLEELDITSPKNTIKEYNLETSPIKVTLNPSYPSTGEIDLTTNNMDLSLDLIIEFSGKKDNVYFANSKLNMTIPMTGTIDRDSGIIKLSGEATIPPEKLKLPLPISIQVIATSNPVMKPNVNNGNDKEAR